MRVALVGPTHPFKGGVAAHTTTLAHELAEAGHDVTLVSWSHLYPAFLYPGEQAVPGGAPDVEPFPRTLRVLSWARPDTWLRAGRRLREFDVVVVVHVVPAVVPAHLALLRAAGAGGGRGPRVVVVAHNVLPHEPGPGDRPLVGALLRRADAVLV
ncbi:MAG: glycosyltransferase, partial [Micrococcales bacterium]|nr:glycosyltransferase [Micrococcales bacterium]